MQFNIDKAADIEGWMASQELQWLAKTARGCDAIVEIGCYLGRSTRAILDNTDALVLAVDPWEDTYYDKNNNKINILKQGSYEIFNHNLKDYIESGQLKIMRCYSDAFPELGKFCDFIFIDGDHRYEQVVRDIQLARKITKKGGIIAGHDYEHRDWPGVKQAVDEIYPDAEKVDTIWWIRN